MSTEAVSSLTYRDSTSLETMALGESGYFTTTPNIGHLHIIFTDVESCLYTSNNDLCGLVRLWW